MELYNKLDELSLHKENIDVKRKHLLIDSVVKVASTLSPAAYSAILLKTVYYSSKHDLKDIATQYIQILDTLPFPEIDNKATGFLLLQEYTSLATTTYYKPKFTNLPQLASLLFDMENRQKLTPLEKCNLLTLKAHIYNHIFKEPTAAFSIISQATQLAQQHKISGPPLWNIYVALARICYKLENQISIISASQELWEFIDKAPIDSLNRKSILSNTLFNLYYQHQNYPQAHYWLKKSGMAATEKYQSSILKFYLDIDSIPAAIAYLEKHRYSKITKQEIHTRIINWHETLIYERAGDTVKYEHFLRKTVNAFDQARSQNFIEIDGCAPSEAYARLLLKKGKLNEAIRRMEIVTHQIAKENIFYQRHPYIFKQIEQRLQRLEFLTSLYQQAGRPNDALRQTQLCDSIRNIYQKSRSKHEQDKNTARMYTAELERNLNLKAAELLREQHKSYAIALFLGIALACFGALLLLYHRRKKQIDILYAQQKVNEQLQEEKQQTQPSITSTLSPEEELFNQLERQFYDKQLFRNPDFSRDDLCRLGGSNRMYISTCINKYTGGNINQWINKARVDYAIHLIRSGETNLQVIAETAGFSSTTSFFRNFKQFTQLTPKQYIQREK